MVLINAYFFVLILYLMVVNGQQDFMFTEFPSEVVTGSVYHISWTGANGWIDLRLQRSSQDDTWFPYVYEGTDDQTDWNVTNIYDLIIGHTYVFAAYLNSTKESHYTSPFLVEQAPTPSQLASTTSSSVTIAAATSQQVTAITTGPSSTPISSLSSIPSSDSQDDRGNTNLHIGQVVGIALGSAAAVVVLSALLGFYIFRKRQRQHKLQETNVVGKQPKHEIEAREVTKTTSRPISYELPSYFKAVSQELAGAPITTAVSGRAS